MNTCFGSIYLSIIVYLLMRNLLFYLALKNTKGGIEGLLFINAVVDGIFLVFFPILLLIFGGVC